MLIVVALAYFILENLIIDFVQTVTEYRVKNRWISLVMVAAFAVTLAFVDQASFSVKDSARIVQILWSIYYLGFRWIIYMVSFRKCNLQMFVLYLFTMATNQAYSNFTVVISEKYFILYAFLIEAVVLSLILLYIKLGNKEKMCRHLFAIFPTKAYALVVGTLFVATWSIVPARHDWFGASQIFLLLAYAMMCIMFIIVIKTAFSEAQKKADIEVLSKQVENQLHYYEKINEIYGEFQMKESVMQIFVLS